MRRCRYAVIGAGGIGSAAAYWLSRRGDGDVLCLEQWELGHDRAASEDHSRIIRLGYHASRYTALTRDAYSAFDVVERESGVPLVLRTGALNIAEPGTAGPEILDAYAAAMDEAAIPHERLGGDELGRRWPQFSVTPDHRAIFQADGGIVDIRKAGAVHRALARARGASFAAGTAVTAIAPRADGVELTTSAGPVTADRVVLCGGAWNRRLLAGLGLDWPISLTHEQVTYFATPNLADFAPDRFPIWIWHGDDDLYGFPVYGEVATKAAIEGGPSVSIEDFSWEPDAARVAQVARFVDEKIPGYAGPELRTRTCLYDMPPDRDFVVDLLPGLPQIAVCVGAGHAAKFAGLLGRVLSELVAEGRTDAPIAAFRSDRPALADPGYAPRYRLGATAVP